MAIVGIGTDRVMVARIRSSVERFGDRFVQRVYTQCEYEQAKAKGDLARRLAMLFAAKEAVAKALGTGFHSRQMETISFVAAISIFRCRPGIAASRRISSSQICLLSSRRWAVIPSAPPARQ